VEKDMETRHKDAPSIRNHLPLMMHVFSMIDYFFFRPIDRRGFGLMRILWAGTTLTFFLFQWSDVTLYYSADGLLPIPLRYMQWRDAYHFSLLAWISDPQAVFALYLLLLLALLCSMIGISTRMMTIVATVLLSPPAGWRRHASPSYWIDPLYRAGYPGVLSARA
jgi:hypothetical protein